MNEKNDKCAGPPCKRLKQAAITLFASRPSKVVEIADKPSSSASSSELDGDSAEAAKPKSTLKPAIVDVIMHPNQPRNREFPSKEYCGKHRRFKETYFDNHKWLHWEETEQSVYCHPCRNIRVLGLSLLAADRSGDNAFTVNGYQSWRTPTTDFQKHERSEKHKECVAKWVHHISGTDVNTQLSAEKSKQQITNMHALEKIFRTTVKIARQGLSLRGHVEDEGNFMQFLHLVAEDNVDLQTYLASSQRRKFLSHDNQNEILSVLSHQVLRSIVQNVLTAKHFAIIADETTDESRKQQMSICLRWTDEDFSVHEDFMGMYEVAKADAETLSSLLLDAITRFGLNVKHLRGQGYDGASVMAGNETGVATRITAIEKRAMFVHCSGHCLSLAVQDAARNVPLIRDALELVKDVVNFIRSSPLRLRNLQSLRQQFCEEGTATPSLRPLCPTRWTVRVSSIKSVLDNYVALCVALLDTTETSRDDAGAKANGFLRRLESFDSYFAMQASLAVLEYCEACNTMLQSTKITTADAKAAATKTADLIHSMRSDTFFDKMYADCEKRAEDMDIAPAVLPRPRRIPRRLDDGADPLTYDTPKDMYRHRFVELIDHAEAAIRRRFEQPGMELACLIENTLTDAATGLCIIILLCRVVGLLSMFVHAVC